MRIIIAAMFIVLGACAKTDRVDVSHPNYEGRILTVEQMVQIQIQENDDLEARVAALELDVALLDAELNSLSAVVSPTIMANMQAAIAVLQSNNTTIVNMQAAIIALQQQVSSIKITNVNVQVNVNAISATLSKCYNHLRIVCKKKCK